MRLAGEKTISSFEFLEIQEQSPEPETESSVHYLYRSLQRMLKEVNSNQVAHFNIDMGVFSISTKQTESLNDLIMLTNIRYQAPTIDIIFDTITLNPRIGSNYNYIDCFSEIKPALVPISNEEFFISPIPLLAELKTNHEIISKDVLAFIKEYELNDAIEIAIKMVKEIYGDDTKLGFERIDDPDSDDKWVVIAIKTSLTPIEIQKLYNTYVSNWVTQVEWPKRSAIKLEHVFES